MSGENAWMYMIGVLGGAYKDDYFAPVMIAEAISKSVGTITGTRSHSMMITPEGENDE